MKKEDKIRLKRENKVCELVELTCPGCGATLNLVDKTHAKCSFCGKEIVIDEAAGTDVYINVDGKGLNQISQNLAIIAKLIKGFVMLCITAAVIGAIIYVVDGLADRVKSAAEPADEEEMEDCGVKRAMEQIFGKKFELISDEEFASIKYLEEDTDVSNHQHVIRYSVEDYDEYRDFDDYSSTIQECRIDMENVSWTKNYTKFTGLEGFADSTSVLEWLEFAPDMKLHFYMGEDDLSVIRTKIDVSEIRELNLPACNSSLAGLEDFKSLKNLQVHGLYGDLQDIDALESCSGLEKLVLDGGEELTDFAPLYNLSHLKELSLYCMNLKSIDFLKKMPELQSLEIKDGIEIDFSPLREVTGLTELSLYGLEDLSLLTGLEKLESLKLHVHDDFFQEYETDYGILATLPSLKKLDLYGDDVSPTEIGGRLEPLLNSEQIEELGIRYVECSIDSALIEENDSIKYLDMSGTRIANEEKGGEFWFVQKMRGLETLILKDCNLRDVSFVTNLENLRVCNVETNFISDFSPLQNNLKLEELYCANNTTSLVDLPESVKVYTKLINN